MLKRPQSADDYLKWITIGAGVMVLGLVGWFVMTQSEGGGLQSGEVDKSKEIAELDRTHVTDISKVKYNSNPPTSGSHFAVWAKSGLFRQVISDGYLIHSLEHGYINISYNCDALPDAKAKPTQFDANKLAKLSSNKAQQYMIAGGEPTVIKLSENFSSSSCKALIADLQTYLKVAQRTIVVPRPQMDTVIALSSWGHLDTMNSIDDKRIKGFIHVYHNKGPEQTME